MKTRILTHLDIERLLPPEDCIDLMRKAFLAESNGDVIQPIRQGLEVPSGKGVLSMMPGALLKEGGLGIKVPSGRRGAISRN